MGVLQNGEIFCQMIVVEIQEDKTLLEIIRKSAMILEGNIQEEMTKEIAKQQQKLKISQNLRKLKKKMKIRLFLRTEEQNPCQTL